MEAMGSFRQDQENKGWERKKAYDKAYHADHREERNGYHRAYRADHKEELKADHREEKRAYGRAYHEEHREERRAYKMWDAKDKELLQEALRQRNKQGQEGTLKGHRNA
ncbi:MAG: hypothetical protein M1822_004780 [Bathelium mastoideum]|nr:MAG: hypothetical protein M1822_004780 [Bathelium mastoideum]